MIYSYFIYIYLELVFILYMSLWSVSYTHLMPSIGMLMRIPFPVTWVCEGEVPRKATVDNVGVFRQELYRSRWNADRRKRRSPAAGQTKPRAPLWLPTTTPQHRQPHSEELPHSRPPHWWSTGCNLNKYIRRVRMEKACGLLLDTNMKVSDISQAAVSYTHLDVYKRQSVILLSITSLFILLQSPFLFLHI